MNARTHVGAGLALCSLAPLGLALLAQHSGPGGPVRPALALPGALWLHVPGYGWLAAWRSAPAAAGAVLLGGAIGALLPDIDQPRSTISTLGLGLTGALARWLDRHVGHRLAVHHPLLWGLLCFDACVWLSRLGLDLCWTLFFALGVASHLLLDGLTIMGLPTLLPRRARPGHAEPRLHLMPVPFLRARSGGLGETVWAVLLALGYLALLVKTDVGVSLALFYGDALQAVLLHLLHAAASASAATLYPVARLLVRP